MVDTIHTDMKLGPVYLTVSDLERSLDFYENSLGFQVHRSEDSIAYLGEGDSDLLVLHQVSDAIRARATTGIYHFAILVPSRQDLARALRLIIETGTQVQGFADHLVSEAIYLPDPDGIGIEIYRDRPRHEWPYDGDQLRMGTEHLDTESLLAEVDGRDGDWEGLAKGTRVGHIHLHVANIAEAEAFYTGVLGFDLVQRYGPAASFFSVGGYHHHIGINTWMGEGAPPPPPGSLGLRHFVMYVQDEAELERITARAEEAGVVIAETELGFQLHDPSTNAIVLTSKIE